MEHIDEGLKAWKEKKQRRCYSNQETAEQLCEVWARKGAARRKAANVRSMAMTAAKKKGKSDDEARAAGERAYDDHLEQYGVWSRTERVCAAGMIGGMRANQNKSVLEALRALADADGPRAAARELVEHIDEGLKAWKEKNK